LCWKKISEIQDALRAKTADGKIATPEEALKGCTSDIMFDLAEMMSLASYWLLNSIGNPQIWGMVRCFLQEIYSAKNFNG
jgi:hypothetical protein